MISKEIWEKKTSEISESGNVFLIIWEICITLDKNYSVEYLFLLLPVHSATKISKINLHNKIRHTTTCQLSNIRDNTKNNFKINIKTLPEAQRTQGIESVTWIRFLTEVNLKTLSKSRTQYPGSVVPLAMFLWHAGLFSIFFSPHFFVFFLLFVCNPVQEEEESISNKSNYFPTSSTFFRPSLSHQRVINLHNAVLMALGGNIKVLESEIISVSSPHSLCQQQPFPVQHFVMRFWLLLGFWQIQRKYHGHWFHRSIRRCFYFLII